MNREVSGESQGSFTDSSNKLTALRQSADAWISSTDGKAMSLLGVGGATLALAGIQSTQRTASYLPFFPSLCFALFCALGVMSCISSVCCLWPRTERKSVLRKRSVQPLPNSPSVFWELGDLDAESFAVNAVYVTEEIVRRDMLEQAMIATWIAKQKLYYLKITIVLLMGSLFALFLSVLSSFLYA